MNVTTINSNSISLLSYLRRVNKYRSLIWMLAVREIKIRYAQTILGLIWAAIQPLTGVAIFTFFFSFLAQMDTGEIPYPLVAITGLTCWNYFSFIMNAGGMSLITTQELIKKLSFPKIALVISKVLIGLADLIVTIIILLLMVIIMGQPITLKILLLPLAILISSFCGLSIALWFSASTIRFRDLQHLVPYIANVGMWFTPVLYPTSIFPEKIAFLLYFNPMALAIELARYSLLDVPYPDIRYMYSLLLLLILFTLGIVYFKNTEKSIPDYI
jgi:lipopolysaccharide transport system permease protein